MPYPVTGSRRFDYNIDGVAHYGLIPDMLADVRNTLDHHRIANPETPDLTPLVQDESLSVEEHTVKFIQRFKEDVVTRIGKFSGI